MPFRGCAERVISRSTGSRRRARPTPRCRSRRSSRPGAPCSRRSEMDPLAKVRREYAEKIRAIAGLHSGALARAFAAVAREASVGPGPWQILGLPDVTRYETTPDADARRLYDNVLVALDADRNLNNGEPATLARWLDALELAPGDRFLHIGCGVGYYTAIAA